MGDPFVCADLLSRWSTSRQWLGPPEPRLPCLCYTVTRAPQGVAMKVRQGCTVGGPLGGRYFLDPGVCPAKERSGAGTTWFKDAKRSSSLLPFSLPFPLSLLFILRSFLHTILTLLPFPLFSLPFHSSCPHLSCGHCTRSNSPVIILAA